MIKEYKHFAIALVLGAFIFTGCSSKVEPENKLIKVSQQKVKPEKEESLYEKERKDFLKFAKSLIKADDEVTEREHQFYMLLKTIWKLQN